MVWALTLISNVYLGIAERALELAVSAATSATSIGLEGRTLAHNPMLQHQIAEMWILLDGARAGLDHLAADWVAGVDHGPAWGPMTFATKVRTARAVRQVLDGAAEVIGGRSIRTDAEISRLWRDARGIAFHPATEAFAHEVIGKAALGLDPDGPRW